MRACAALAILCTAATLSLSSCSPRRAAAGAVQDDSDPPIHGGTLEIAGRADVDHLATTSAYLTWVWHLFRTFTRQLVTYPAEGDYATRTSPAPDLAIEVPTRANGGVSADGLIYTFHLRRGVRWNTTPPREVTAQDVDRGFRLLCNPVAPVGAPTYYTGTIVGMARYCEEFARIPRTVAAIRQFVNTHALEGVRAVDDSTVVFRLLAPAADFLNLLALMFASPVPAEYLEYLPDSPEFRQHTLSCGPYRIVRYIQNREIVLDRNPAWSRAADPIRAAYVDGIHLRLGLDAQLQQLQIEAATADLGFDETVPPAERASLLAVGDPTAWLSPPGDWFGGFQYLVVNLVGPNNGRALEQPKVRQAIALAINKAALVQLAGGPRVARALRQAVPSSVAGYREGADQYVTAGDRGDPAAARRLLTDAGYAASLSLRLAYGTFSSFPIAAQAIQASLAQVGIEVKLVKLNASDFYARLMTNPENARRGEWDLALTGWTADWFGESNGRSVIGPLFDGRNFGSTTNFGAYRSADVDAAIDRAATAPSVELAARSWREAARRVMKDVAIVPLVETKLAFAKSRRVRGCTWSVLGLNCDLTAVWLADAARAAGAAR